MSTLSRLRYDIRKLARLWTDHWQVLLYIELMGLYRAVAPHKNNNLARKVISIFFVGSWTLVFVLQTLGIAEPPTNIWIAYTAIVFMILGRIWQLEIERFPVNISFEGDNSKNE